MHQEYLCVSLVPLFNHLELADQKKIQVLIKHRIVDKREQGFTPDGKTTCHCGSWKYKNCISFRQMVRSNFCVW